MERFHVLLILGHKQHFSYTHDWSNRAELFIKNIIHQTIVNKCDQENRNFNLKIQGTLFILEFFKASCIKFSACTASRKKEKEKKNQ